MLHTTSITRQLRLAADYRDADIRPASRDDAATDSTRSTSAGLETALNPHARRKRIEWLLTLGARAR